MRRGEIWFVEFNGQGHEYQKTRPAIVIESDNQLRITNVITVVPVTKQQDKHSDDIFVAKNAQNKLMYDSVIKVHHIQTFDRGRFVKKIGDTDGDVMTKIEIYLRKHFNL